MPTDLKKAIKFLSGVCGRFPDKTASRLQAALLAVYAIVLLTSGLSAGSIDTVTGGTGLHVCNGKYKGGLKPSPEELKEILRKHKQRLNKGLLYNNSDPDRANLCEADLDRADFTNANLTGANLASANLEGAYLEKAFIWFGDLQGANLEFADLVRADFAKANLEGANLSGTNLTYASLMGADLRAANFTQAHATGAHLDGAKVDGADFDLPPDSLPDPLGLSFAEGLQFVKFFEEPAGLVKLRSEFKDLGLRTQESQLTYAIRRSELCRIDYGGKPVHSRVERWINFVLFDLTCQYGMSPERPLFIVGCLSVIFAGIYALAKYFPDDAAASGPFGISIG